MNKLNMLKLGALKSVAVRSFATNPEVKKILVFGGGGYVGSRIVEQALNAGHTVISVNRSKRPVGLRVNGDDRLTWREGDIFNEADWVKDLEGCDAAISCVGAFGSNEFMQRINGDANIHAISQAQKIGVPRFIYISTVENNLPDFFLRGYFEGKRRAEQALQNAYPEAGSGVALRPSFMYGTRAVSKTSELSVPLGLLGRPLELLLNNSIASQVRAGVPGMMALLAAPIAVEDVATAALRVAEGHPHAVAICANPPHSVRRNLLSRDDIALITAITTAAK